MMYIIITMIIIFLLLIISNIVMYIIITSLAEKNKELKNNVLKLDNELMLANKVIKIQNEGIEREKNIYDNDSYDPAGMFDSFKK